MKVSTEIYLPENVWNEMTFSSSDFKKGKRISKQTKNSKKLKTKYPFSHLKNACHRCGRKGHSFKKCIAKRDVNDAACVGEPCIEPEELYKNNQKSKISEPATILQKDCSPNTSTQKETLNNVLSDQPLATESNSGFQSIFQSSDILMSLFGHSRQTLPFENIPNTCDRCGNKSHTLEMCRALNDVNGQCCQPLVSEPLKSEPKDKDTQNAKAKNLFKIAAQKKKLPCTAWSLGKCVLDIACAYSHEGPGYDPRSRQLCFFARNGSCLKGSSCIYSHDKSTFPCVFYHFSTCKNEKCLFSHEPITPEQKLMLELDQKKYEQRVLDKEIENKVDFF